MGAQFPIPILSVAADAVRDLEGRDALSGLWTLFTKCKESLQDGRRLENISWRLWYREMMLTNFERELNNSEKLNALTRENPNDHEYSSGVALVVDKKAFYPLVTPSDSAPNPPPYLPYNLEGDAPPSMPQHEPHLLSDSTSLVSSSSPAHFPSLSPAPSPRLSPSIPEYNRQPSLSRSPRSSFFNGTNGTPINVGKIIFDMLPSSSSSSSSGDSNKGGMTALFLPRPAFSHMSTSSTFSSGSDIDIKPESDMILPQTASLRLDPMIQMTPIEPSSSPTTRASLNVIDGVRSTKFSIPDLPSTPISGKEVSCLPTPETEESEPNHKVVAVPHPPSDTTCIQDTSSSKSTIPTSSIRSDSIPSNDTTTSFSLSNGDNDKPQHDLDHNSTSSLVTFQAVYTGPPSPSLSDTYARAHPGEVEVKEVGLLPSFSVSNSLTLKSSPSQPRVDADDTRPSVESSVGNQTPPFSSSRIAPPIRTSFQHPDPPTLVVVNPTPNPTPHPTPPATPLMHGIIGPGGLIRSQWLTLPEGGTGSRQHQLLQAAQLQLAPQLTVLRLPPSLDSSGINVTTTTTIGAVNRDLDRSRSTAGFSESHSQVSLENAAFVTLERSHSLSDRQSSSLPKENQEQLQHKRSSSSSSLVRDNHQFQQHQRRDSPKRLSISSTTSSHRSQTSTSDRSSVGGCAESTTTTDTTVSECENLEKLAGLSSAEKVTMFEVHSGGIGMTTHGPKRLGSLSTIQSTSTLTDRRKDVGGVRASDSDANVGVGAGVIPVSDEEVILEYDEEDDTAPLSPLPPPGGLAMSPRSDKWRKRNSAPALPTSSSALLAVSPTASGSSQLYASSPRSTSTASGIHSATRKRKQITAGGGLSSGRSTSRSRSAGGSSVGKNRSRSREPGVGLGGFGMTQAAPPPVAARKAPMVAGGRGRAKVVLGRTGAKAKGAMRRNSSGTGARSDNGVVEQEQETGRAEREGERAEKEHQERMRMEALEKERERSLQVAEDKRKVEELALGTIRQREAEDRQKEEEDRREEERRQREREEGLTVGLFDGEEGGSKRPVRFNIGSNSDEGSGIGSKSAGSGSDFSGAHTKAQGKERQRDVDQRDIAQKHQAQQQQHQHQPPSQNQLRQQQHFQQQPQRQLSKLELHQLQMMEQLHMQQQNQTRIQQHHLQHQHQLQSQQRPQLGQEHYPPPSRQVSTKQIERDDVKDGERVDVSRKGKEREVEPTPIERKPTKSNSKANVVLDPDLAAKVQQSLAAPLLPQNRRKIVLATSESDFETDSDDDGSWSSEDMTGDEEEQRAQDEQFRQQQLQQQRLLQQQQQQQQLQQQQIQLQRQLQQQQQHAQLQQHQHQPARPQGVQRTQSSHYPAPNNARTSKHGSRAQQRHQGQVNAQAIINAAAEVQRQREMFVKLPSSSFQNLANARTRSVGLLTQLMNPNPEIFPPNHPYRRGFSSSEIRPGGAATGVAPMRPLTSTAPSATKDSQAPQAIPEEGSERPAQRERRSDGPHDRKSTGAAIPSRMNFSPPTRPGGMNRTKSAVALPVSYQVAVGSVTSKALPVVDHTSVLPTTANGITTSSSGKFRLRAPPADAEMEDDSGSEAEPGGLSKSVAHEKLKALAQKGGITANAHRNPDLSHVHLPTEPGQNNGDDDDVPHWVVSRPQQQPQRTRSNPQKSNGVQFVDMPDTSRTPSNPNPIPFGYPYNLPISAAPSTPRTTRRQMLSTELPESLRRNLLWERQISNGNLAAMRRSASGGGSRHNVLGGPQPLTVAPRMVQLHAKGTGPPESAVNDDRQRGAPAPAPGPAPTPAPANEEERRRSAMARNKSWANDYHYSGW